MKTLKDWLDEKQKLVDLEHAEFGPGDWSRACAEFYIASRTSMPILIKLVRQLASQRDAAIALLAAEEHFPGITTPRTAEEQIQESNIVIAKILEEEPTRG